ncbi:MAG: hypothetical protein SGJ11_11385 [Phycisphaerae bacterium]|nr:hypothetical protein [Phycisphaerae bacterium]
MSQRSLIGVFTSAVLAFVIAGQLRADAPSWIDGHVFTQGSAFSANGSNFAAASGTVTANTMSGGGSTGSGPVFGSVDTAGAITREGAGYLVHLEGSGSATIGDPKCERCGVSLAVQTVTPKFESAPLELLLTESYAYTIETSGTVAPVSFAPITGSIENGVLLPGTYAISFFLSVNASSFSPSVTESFDWKLHLTPAPRGSPADLDDNGVVDAVDLTLLLGAWGTAGADLNGDGTTGAADLAILLAAWTV